MIRKSIFTLLMLSVIGFVSAQSLRFELNGTVFEDGTTIECTNEVYGEFFQSMQIRNLTSNDLGVIIEKEVVEDLEGTMNYFCWGQCFLSTVFVSNPVTIAANSLNSDDLSFHVMFEEDVYGKVHMRFYAYDENHPNERVSINVVFKKSGVGLNDNTHPMEMSEAYPNPASSVVNFDYALDGNLTAVVYNLLGQEVLRKELNASVGQMTFSVAGLQDGIYFCTLMANGQAWTTKKFVVKK